MLTRIEIDGFKSFEGLALDLSPFAVVLGPNASGKSNLFDAIRLLSRLAEHDLRTAARGLRGDVATLFRRTAPDSAADRMQLAVEVLLDPVARDPWGREVELRHTRARYEVEIQRTMDERGLERLSVVREAALPILSMSDRWRPFGGRPHRAFRERHLRYSRRTPWLETVREDDLPGFRIHQDGSAGRTRPGHAAEATVLSSITTADFPHLYALRQELRSWRLLQLDPAGLRRPSPLDSDELLAPDGSNLAAVLYRIRTETRTSDRPEGILPEILAELSAIIPGVLSLEVELNEPAREYRAQLRLRDGVDYPAAVISDGTLRVLALLTMLKDPRHSGLVCFEEPENGVHPARLAELVRRLRSLVTDPLREELTEPPAPLSQLLLNSHSPVVLSALQGQGAGQVLFADLVTVADPETGTTCRKTRIRSVQPSSQGDLLEPGSEVTRFEVARYLRTVNEGA